MIKVNYHFEATGTNVHKVIMYKIVPLWLERINLPPPLSITYLLVVFHRLTENTNLDYFVPKCKYYYVCFSFIFTEFSLWTKKSISFCG